MKMVEFLALSDDEKVRAIEAHEPHYKKTTSDSGTCSQCGKKADAGDFCFGCHKLICGRCFEKEPHYSQCLAK